MKRKKRVGRPKGHKMKRPYAGTRVRLLFDIMRSKNPPKTLDELRDTARGFVLYNGKTPPMRDIERLYPYLTIEEVDALTGPPLRAVLLSHIHARLKDSCPESLAALLDTLYSSRDMKGRLLFTGPEVQEYGRALCPHLYDTTPERKSEDE